MTLDIGRNSRQEAMAERSRRRCVAQIVVGYSADDSLAWLGDDRTFFGDSSDESLGDDDQSDDAAPRRAERCRGEFLRSCGIATIGATGC